MAFIHHLGKIIAVVENKRNKIVVYSTAVWKLVKTILTAEQQRKVLFVKKSEIQKYIHPDQLWRHMGGNVSSFLGVSLEVVRIGTKRCGLLCSHELNF